MANQIHDGIAQRPMTDDEQANYDAVVAEQQARKNEQLALEAARVSALAKLAALGLTADEIKALVG